MKKLDFTPKNVINCVHNEPAFWDTRVMGHRTHRRPSWNYCTYQLISLAFISGSIVLYASYLCLSPIYCLTHVECFRFFMAANINFVWSRFEASLQLAFDLLASLRPGLQLGRIMECGLYQIRLRLATLHVENISLNNIVLLIMNSVHKYTHTTCSKAAPQTWTVFGRHNIINTFR